MQARIVSESGRFLLYVADELIGSYTRKSSAVRRLNGLAARTAEKAVGADARDAAAAAGRAAVQPPPASNTGGQPTVQGEAAVSRVVSSFVMVNGKLKEIALRRGHGTAAHIDTLTLTFPRSVLFTEDESEELKTDDDVLIARLDGELTDILGYGLYKSGKGLHGYERSYVMGVDEVKYGFAAFGGNRNTVCLHLYGAGCISAKDGWEARLHGFLQERAPMAKITRCDLAHDFLNGEYTVMQAYHDWLAGQYTNSTKAPVAEMAGQGWLNDPTGGKTLYVGSRKNGSKLLRVYEKGIEQGDSSSPWVRFELQLRNRDIVIDHDILLEPGCYLVGAYPIGEVLFAGRDAAKKCERVRLAQTANLTHVLKYASIQVAPAIKMLQHLGLNSDEVVSALERKAADFPKRLHPAAFEAVDARFMRATHKSPLYSHELADFLFDEFVEKQPRKDFSEAEAKAEAERFKTYQYLKCVFGREPYDPDVHGCDYDTYLHRRYGAVMNN